MSHQPMTPTHGLGGLKVGETYGRGNVGERVLGWFSYCGRARRGGRETGGTREPESTTPTHCMGGLKEGETYGKELKKAKGV